MMEATPPASFIVPEPDLLLEFLIIAQYFIVNNMDEPVKIFNSRLPRERGSSALPDWVCSSSERLMAGQSSGWNGAM